MERENRIEQKEYLHTLKDSTVCPVWIRNDKISHFIFVLFIIPLLVLCFIARFCLQKQGVFAILQSTRERQRNVGKCREMQGNAGKNKEKTKGLSLSFFASILHFIISVLADAIRCRLVQISTYLSCILYALVSLFGA